MPLGYRGHADWRDMSEFVVHFTGGASDHEALDRLFDILHSQTLKAGPQPFGAARGIRVLGASQQSICFSEVPLDLLSRLVARRRSYGLGFHQRTLVRNGGGRVWYIDRDSPLNEFGFDALLQQKWASPIDTEDPFWRLTPFVDRPVDKPTYRFEWEREWRVPSLDLRFEVLDVAFLFAPASQHQLIREWFHRRTGPLYDHCPFVDPAWSIEQIQAAVAKLPDVPVRARTHQITGAITEYVVLDEAWVRCRWGGDVVFVARQTGQPELSGAVLRDAEELGVEEIRVVLWPEDFDIAPTDG